MITQTPAIPSSLAVWTGYLLTRAAQKCRSHFDGLAEPLGIHGRHFAVLALLGEDQPLAQVEIGERLGIDRNTVVLLLDDLEGQKLVTRRRDPNDRRAHRVRLTGAGREMLTRAEEMARRTNQDVFAPLSPDEQAQLHSLLGRLL